MRLTRHFVTRWQERMGGCVPTPQMIRQLVRHSVVLQHGRRVEKTGFGRPYTTLSMYWVPEIDVVMKIDEVSYPHCAVTVITPDVRKCYVLQ